MLQLNVHLCNFIVISVLINVNNVISSPRNKYHHRIKNFSDEDDHPIVISSAHHQLYHNDQFQSKRLPTTTTTTRQPFLHRSTVMTTDFDNQFNPFKTHLKVNVSVLPLKSRPIIVKGPTTSSTSTTTTTTTTTSTTTTPAPRVLISSSTTTTTPSSLPLSSTQANLVVQPSTTHKPPKPTKGRSELDMSTSSSVNNLTIAHPINQQDNKSGTSLLQPLTLLLMSYLANRKINSLPADRNTHGLKYLPSYPTHPLPSVINNSFYESSDHNLNDNETESRTIASWFGGLTRRLKRPKHPHRRDHTVGPGRGTIPIHYETAPISLASLHGPSLASIGRPGSSSDQMILPGLLPQPEGFPGPYNPENSVLLPPDIMENSGIKYWLDFIEKGGTTDDIPPSHYNGSPAPLPPHFSSSHHPHSPHPPSPLSPQTIFETAGSDHDEVDFNNAVKRQFKRPPIQAKPDGNRHGTRYRPNQNRPSNGGSNSGNGNNGNQGDNQKHSYGETSDSHDGTDRIGNNNNNNYDSDRHKNEMSPRCDKFTAHICVDDFEYPEQAIVDEIYKRRDIFELMYSEVKGNPSLVDGIPRDVEESYSYDIDDSSDDSDEDNDSPGDRNDVLGDERVVDPMYSAANSDSFIKSGGRQGIRSSGGNDGSSGTNGASNNNGGGSSSKDTASSGYVCPSEVLYGKPKLARNMKGDWKVIVNAAEFTQTVRMEKCLRPNQRCNYVTNIGIASRCAQVHSFHRLMVFEKGKGFYIDTFRIPTACSCHIRRTGGPTGPSPMSDLLGLNESPGTGSGSSSGSNLNGANGGTVGSNNNGHVSIGKSPTPIQLSNALWSILGSGPGNQGPTTMSGNPFSVLDNINAVNSDLLKAQLSVLSSLKNYPSLTGSISPESVLQQLTSQSDAIQNIQGLTGSFNPTTGFSSITGKSPSSNNPNDLSNNEYLLPGMIYAEEPLSFQEHSDNLGGRLSSSHPSGTFTRGSSSPLSSSSSSSSSSIPGSEMSNGGTPLVQVIHVPVSSHPLSPQLQRHHHHGSTTSNIQFPVYKQPINPTNTDLHTLTAYASASKSSADALKSERKPPDYFSTEQERNKMNVNRASDSNSNSNSNNNQNNFDSNQHDNDNDHDSNQQSTKLNETISTYDSVVLTSTPKVAVTGESNSHVTHPQETIKSNDKNDSTNNNHLITTINNKSNDTNTNSDKTLANSVSDGKVNFSYHPILEYILPSQSTS
ncbi:probable cyclin-dependent serine/threonine-protein kinase DDB_G0292550 [Panonychus citri]|uniref:probable cyclin-dependent serine/threonine-protein kinase DDB_G0292550 n=1 Tax=Panonychus citri TaxID=50023 RepID=UPI00230725BA|nr:probable cyclin-dependent serine/threonine-protein kinase DDB_G0292550 [Panonychus citri]